MKAAIYNPYWDTLGGGERYTSAFVDLLLENNYKVDIQWENKDLIKRIGERFSIDISGANVVKDIKRGDGYDLCFWISDGSIPTLKSRKNILHFQFPFQNTEQNSLLNKIKLFRIKHIVCNSHFTKSFIDKEYGVNSTVVYPPVDVEQFKSGKKTNTILYIGRFSQLAQAKNQHILVDAFKNFCDKYKNRKYNLVLAGGAEVGGEKYIKDLVNKTKNYPIKIIKNPAFKEIKKLYAKSKFFWSAVGCDIDEKKEPMKVEHFGMTVVEAMSAGSIAIVPYKGGYKEIITDKKNGFFWGNKQELVSKTVDLAQDKDKMSKLAVEAQKSSSRFSLENFRRSFKNIV